MTKNSIILLVCAGVMAFVAYVVLKPIIKEPVSSVNSQEYERRHKPQPLYTDEALWSGLWSAKIKTCILGTPNDPDHAIVYVLTILLDGGNQANVNKTIAHEIGHDVDITGDHASPPDCIMNQGLLIRNNYCANCLSQRRLH